MHHRIPRVCNIKEQGKGKKSRSKKWSAIYMGPTKVMDPSLINKSHNHEIVKIIYGMALPTPTPPVELCSLHK